MFVQQFKNLIGLVFLSCCLFSQLARAQEISDRANLFYRFVYKKYEFNFKVEDSFGAFTNVSNKVFRPKGDGPFPAVVLVHTAGGLANRHVQNDAERLVDKGYVVLILDSMGPRGVKVITERDRALYHPTGVKDAYIALDFLKNQTYVDKDRIYQAGYSWGGFVASLLGSPALAKSAGATDRFRATVSFYSSCRFFNNNFILSDIDRPLLMLLAGDDRETPLGTCVNELNEYRSKGLPIDYHVYEKASHGWDKMGEAQHGFIYNEEVTKDAFKRMLDFFEKNK